MQFFEILISLFAACVVMVLHELPKALLFIINCRVENKKSWKKKVLKIHNYIDPIGLVLMIVCYSGFSRPFMFHVRDRKKNIYMGVLGFITLSFLFLTSVWILKYRYGITHLEVTGKGYGAICFQLFWIYFAMFSGSMLFVNLFPVSVFDMGLLIAGTSAKNYLSMLAKDTYVKLVMMLFIVVGWIRLVVFQIIETMLAV